MYRREDNEAALHFLHPVAPLDHLVDRSRAPDNEHFHPQLPVVAFELSQKLNTRRIHIGNSREVQYDVLGKQIVVVFQTVPPQLGTLAQHLLGVEAYLPVQHLLENGPGGEVEATGEVEDLDSFDFDRLENKTFSTGTRNELDVLRFCSVLCPGTGRCRV